MERQVQDEINLYELWQIIASRKTVLIVFVLVVAISTAIVSSFMPKIYRGDALLYILQYEESPSKGALQAKEIVDMIGGINRERLARILPETYTSVTDLKLKPIKDSNDKLLVTIEAKNTDNISKALLEVLDYINNFEIVKMTVKEEKETLLKRSNELSDVINSSANLSNLYRKLLNEGKLFPVGFNPVDLNKRIADIKLEKLSVDQRVQRLNGGAVGIARQLYIQTEPVKPRIGKNVVLGSVISIFLGIFLIFLENYFRRPTA